MKIQLWSIGKQHDLSIISAIEDYTRRINKYIPTQWNIIPPPKNASSLSELELKKKEGELVIHQLGKDDFLIVLDEKGISYNSVKLANFLDFKRNEGIKQLVFLIGGAYGIADVVKEHAKMVWSLSELTFPHQIVRLLLAEQLYRACTINKNEKYHHS